MRYPAGYSRLHGRLPNSFFAQTAGRAGQDTGILMSATDAAASPSIAAVAFDLDGLLVNTEELYQDVGTEILRRRRRLFDADLLDAMMGRPQQVALSIMIEWHQLDDSVETLAAETKEIFQSLLADRLALMPGAAALVNMLEELRLPRAVATSSGPDFAHDVLERVGLLDRLAFVLTSADVSEGKPHPEIYETAAARHGIPPQQLLVFEDSENGCRAAVASGAVVVAVPGDHSHRHSFHGAHLIADSLADPRITALLPPGC
jgi:HAD superfamily hydrolase (TIGR01509 family)